jgi:hypothetical protein
VQGDQSGVYASGVVDAHETADRCPDQFERRIGTDVDQSGARRAGDCLHLLVPCQTEPQVANVEDGAVDIRDRGEADTEGGSFGGTCRSWCRCCSGHVVTVPT